MAAPYFYYNELDWKTLPVGPLRRLGRWSWSMQKVNTYPDQAAPLTPRQRLSVELVSGLLILVGVAAMAWFVLSVANNAKIDAVRHWTATTPDAKRPSLLLAFLDSFGIVVPALVIAFGLSFVRLGLWLRSLNINAARWAEMAFRWLAIGAGLLAALHFATSGADFDALRSSLPLALAVLPAVAALGWLSRNADSVCTGQETLAARQTRSAWNLLMPTAAVLIIVAARPLEQTFINSLTDKRFASGVVPHYIGLENYSNLLSLRLDTVECRRDDVSDECRHSPDGSMLWQTIDRKLLEKGYRTAWNITVPLFLSPDKSISVSGMDRDWLRSMWTTLQFTVLSVFFELVIGLFIALVVNSGFKGRGFMRAVMLIPWAIPTVISARLWELILKDTSAGIVNRVLMDVGLLARPEAWLVQPNLQIPSAVMVDVWKTSPFMALLLLAGLQTIPSDLYEAAAVDGATRLRQLRNITLPLLRPAIAVALVFRTLDALRVFDLFNVLFGRQQLTMATYNYEALVNNQADGYASAIGVLIFLFIFLFAVIYVRLLGVEME